MNKPMVFYGQLYDVRTKKDGGGRLQIDFGADALLVVQEIQRMATLGGDCNFHFAVVRVDPNQDAVIADSSDEETF